ncbi:MAG: Sensor protein ZraS [Verrucomicrobiota bacterium]|jgi:signal transduction histidine kinase
MAARAIQFIDNDSVRTNRLFDGIPSELLTNVSQGLQFFSYRSNEIIFRDGDPGDCLFLVCEGSVRISKTGRGGNQETLGFIQKGDFFGEMALVDGQPRSAQACASEDSVICRLDQAAFDRILALAPGHAHMNFLRSVVARLRSVNSQFVSELMRNERINTLGTMANSIIHDLKSPITVVRSCCELLANRFQEPTVVDLCRLMNKSVDGMLDMIQELLDFTRGQSSVQLVRRPANEVLDELKSTLPRLLPTSIHLILEDGCTDEILIDVGRFGRVILNLVKNAVEAMKNGGIIWVGVRREGEHVIFKVGDTGCGIPAALQARIFEPFITHGKSSGTGLGLAIVKSVVDSHNGTISLHSKEGIGTTFEISLPVAKALTS